MKKIKDFFVKNKIHIIIILIFIALTCSRYWDYLSFTNVRRGDPLSGSVGPLSFVRKSVLEYHQFPLWYPHSQGGFPFFAHPTFPIFSMASLVSLLVSSPIGIFNVSQLLGILVSGLFMYILMLNLNIKSRFAFISALFYMFGPFAVRAMGDPTETMHVYFMAPLIFLFLWRSVTKKEWLKNAVITGILLSIQFLGNGYDFSLFMVLLFLSFFFVYTFTKNISKRLVKVALVSIVILFVFLGLFSIKLFPLLEYNEASSKKQVDVFSYERSIDGANLENNIKDFPDFFQALLVPIEGSIRNIPHNHIIKLGFSGFFLLLFSLSLWKKRTVMSLVLLIILTLLIAAPTPFWYLFWKFVPMFNRLHHLDRSMYLYCFATSVLIGIGCSVMFNKLGKRFNKKHINLLYLLVAAIVIADLFFVSGYIKGGRINSERGQFFNSCLQNNYLLQNLSKEEGVFRISNIKTKSHAGVAPAMISLLDLQMLYGGIGTWIPEMYTFLGIAHSFPAKFYGMLNTKYLYSNEPVNITGLRFVTKFDNFELCNKYEDRNTDFGINGPYLYYNELYLPRAYLAEHSILILGSKDAVDGIAYALMANENFDPSNTVIVMAYEKVNNYELDFLKRFNAVVLTQGSIDQGSLFILNQYDSSGGIILPNIVKGEDSISQERIDSLLSSFKGDYRDVKEIDINYYSPNKIIMELDEEVGWLVLSEKFHMFQGWEPEIDNKERNIYRANGMNSAVYLEGESGELLFKYQPGSFKKGLVIFSVTLVLVILLLAYGSRRQVTG